MTTEQDLKSELVEVLTRELNIKIPSPETDLVSESLLDSFGLVNLIMLLDKQWDVKVSTDKMDLENFRSIERIAAFIESERTS